MALELEDRFYTSTEVAEILGVSLRSIYRYLEEDKLTAEVKTVTGRHRFTKQNILDFLYPDGGNKKSDQNTQAQTTVQTQVSPQTVTTTQGMTQGVVSQQTTVTAPVADQGVLASNVSTTIDSQLQPQPQQQTITTTETNNGAGMPEDSLQDQGEESQPSEIQDVDISTQTNDQASESDSDSIASAEDADADEASATETTQQPEQSTDSEDEDIDWLSKFRAAAQKYREETKKTDATPASVQSQQQSEPVQQTVDTQAQSQPQAQQATQQQEQPQVQAQPQVAAQPQQATQVQTQPQVQQTTVSQAPTQSVSGIGTQTTQETQPEEPKQTTPGIAFYKSGVGGLKEVAQQLDKSAKKASVEYAFTMNAGLSLHKPIKPFSILHAYVKPDNKEFFENILKLTPADKDVAQLCLMFTTSQAIFSDSREMHGLSVVSDVRLKTDLMNNGEEELAKEFEEFLS